MTVFDYRNNLLRFSCLLYSLIFFGLSENIFSQESNLNLINADNNGLRIKFDFHSKSFIQNVDGKNYFSMTALLDESTPGKPQLPSRTFFVAIPPNSRITVGLINESEILFENAEININPKMILKNDSTFEYKDFEISDNYLVSDNFPSAQVEVLDYFWIRDYYCAAIKINPLQFNWKRKSLNSLESAELNISFLEMKPFVSNDSPSGDFDKELKEIILNYESAQDFRSVQPGNTNDISGEWIDYSKTHFKLSVIRDGIYRIRYTDLLSYGIVPSSINPKTIKMFKRGSQIPIYIEGEDDFSFDESDYIEFWCTRNYNPEDYRNIVNMGQDYINYMDRYSDTTVIWLTYDGEDGLRVPVVKTTAAVTADTIKSHITKRHFESDVRLWYYGAEDPRTQLPFWQEHKVFTWLTIGYTGSQSINFTAADFVPNSPVITTSRLISNAANVITNAHKHGSSLNSTTYQDSIIFDYYKTVNFTSTFSSDQLIEGNNTYRIFGLVSDASFHRSLIDWVDIEYYRFNKALNDTLFITIPDSVTNDLRHIRITNILVPDSVILIYKVESANKRITGFTLSDGVLVFMDSVKGGDKYFISKKTNYLTPKFNYSKQFVNLRDQSLSADYILITHKTLTQSTDEYLQLINENYNLRTLKVYIDDIYDEFSYGQNWAESIKYFLKYAYDNWQKPSPSYVNLVGDANYDYKDIWNPAPTPRKKNLVPSYGFPVSDIWFTTWNESNINLPQMYIGRIPANNDQEVSTYLFKYQSYLDRRYDDYNKRFTFYSGGDPTKPIELAQIKAANDILLNNYINPEPISGKGIHFYKTTDPVTNFGPYTFEEIQNAVDSSGLFISYIGHSGTRTWDNGITEVEDIKNAFEDRNPLISDFGCSTGKFAEPDVDAFGELFIAQSPNGQAVGYLGNSSLGFLSTSLRFPELFYKRVLLDSSRTLSAAHILAKLDQFSLYGYNDVNRVFNYCNILFADPLLKLALPDKPNFVVNAKSVTLLSQVSDLEDSILVNLKIYNWGKTTTDSLHIIISNSISDSVNFIENIFIPSPLFGDQVNIYLKTGRIVGEHTLKIQLDPDDLIKEIYEDDNYVEINYSVFSTSVRPIETENFYASRRDSIRFLNPTYFRDNYTEEFFISISTNPDFQDAQEIKVKMDTLLSRFTFPNLIDGERYYYRVRLNSPEIEWSPTYSFKNFNREILWFVDSDHNPSDVMLMQVRFDDLDLSWKLQKTLNEIKILSAGFYAGSIASIIFNAEEALPNTYFWGIATAEIDSLTFEPQNVKYFAYPNSITQNSTALINYIDALPEGKMVALTICDDAAQTVLGFSGGTPVRRAIETLGSLYIDSVRYRESWCMLGIKGAPTGSVPESYKKLFGGAAIIDTSKLVVFDEGFAEFPQTGKSSGWQKVSISSLIPDGANIEIIPLGIKQNNVIDTLNVLSFESDTASITDIDASLYPQIKLLAKLNANELKESPSIYSIGIDYIPPPELAINYQIVYTDKDSVYQGEYITLNFFIFNAGYSSADSFNVKIFIKNPESQLIEIFDSLITRLDSQEKLYFSIPYRSNIQDGFGDLSFIITADVSNKITEIYKDNNTFIRPFFVIKDTNVTSITESSVKATFDGEEILDGDYVSSNPEISISFSYPLWFPIDDTTSIKIYIDNKDVRYSEFSINYDTVNRIAQYTFKPTISDGYHNMRVFGKDINGIFSSSPYFEKNFVVSSELTLLNPFNYPNPFSDNTYFTFIIPVLPDELKINIYSIAGRKIKEIRKAAFDLKVGFNTIEWDGRDEDGDYIANGTYLCKIIIKDSEKTYTTTQKLSKIK